MKMYDRVFIPTPTLGTLIWILLTSGVIVHCAVGIQYFPRDNDTSQLEFSSTRSLNAVASFVMFFHVGGHERLLWYFIHSNFPNGCHQCTLLSLFSLSILAVMLGIFLGFFFASSGKLWRYWNNRVGIILEFLIFVFTHLGCSSVFPAQADYSAELRSVREVDGVGWASWRYTRNKV